MNKEKVKSIKERLMREKISPSEIGFDESEYKLELETLEEDQEWLKKKIEEQKRGYDTNNWHEGEYEIK